MDACGRIIDYLRLSITDRCNERCLYCMPEGYCGWEQTPDALTSEEILRVVRVAAKLGFRKFRLTGGEPLVRRDVVELVRAMRGIPGVERIGLSTNGTRLATLAAPLREAGLDTVNVSLDALSPEAYRRITGGRVERAIAGIRSAVAVGYERMKLNTVLLRGHNEAEIRPLIRFAAGLGLPLRLIELMPVTETEGLDETAFLSVAEVMDELRREEELIPAPNLRLGHGPAKYFRLARTGALVGFIGALTTPHFCDTCNRMRLTADGQLRPCLGNDGEIDLRALLRSGTGNAGLTAQFRAALRQKPARHAFCGEYAPCRPMTAIGG